MVGADFAWFADRVHSFGHGEFDASFFAGSSQLSGVVPLDFPVLSVPGVETQQLFLSARIEAMEPVLHLPALWRGG
jgi:hypothetical protein